MARAHAALAQTGEAGGLLGVLDDVLFEQDEGEVALGDGVEPDDPATGDHGVELGLGGAGDQDQDGAGRGFFEGLEEGVGGFLAEVVGVVHDGDAAVAVHGLEAQVVAEVADQADRQVVLVLGFGDEQKVGVGLFFDLLAAWAFAAGFEGGVGVTFAEEGLSEGAGEEALADALRPDEEEGVGEPALFEAAAKLG